MIDPQSQANKWIKNMEMDNSLSIVRFTTPNYTKILEHSISNGQPVITRLQKNTTLLLQNILLPILGVVGKCL